MHIYYRISDTGYNKIKPPFINNSNCLHNFIGIFSKSEYHISVIADNVSSTTYDMIENHVPSNRIKTVSIGNGAGTFNIALDDALNISNENEIVYFVENDYLHKSGSDSVLIEGFDLNPSFITLYDHPDKYLDPSHGGNPYCTGGAENTRLYLTRSCHWKITNSTTMTFAAKVKTLKQAENILRKWTNETHPHDFQMFLDLQKHHHVLISSVPGYATHGETQWMCPLHDWEKEAM
jgi:hypothetical protein